MRLGGCSTVEDCTGGAGSVCGGDSGTGSGLQAIRQTDANTVKSEILVIFIGIRIDISVLLTRHDGQLAEEGIRKGSIDYQPSEPAIKPDPLCNNFSLLISSEIVLEPEGKLSWRCNGGRHNTNRLWVTEPINGVPLIRQITCLE